jgi:hypothetical protein
MLSRSTRHTYVRYATLASAALRFVRVRLTREVRACTPHVRPSHRGCAQPEAEKAAAEKAAAEKAAAETAAAEELNAV